MNGSAKTIIIIVLVVAAIVLGIYLFKGDKKNETSQITSADRYDPFKCIPRKSRSDGSGYHDWDENNIPYGHLKKYAAQANKSAYADDPDYASYQVGGFFKAINVYPTDSSFKSYRQELDSYLKNDGSTWGNVVQGSLEC